MDSETKPEGKSCGKRFYWSGTVTGLGAGFIFAAIYTRHVPASESGDILRVIGFLLMMTGMVLTNSATNRAKNIPRPLQNSGLRFIGVWMRAVPGFFAEHPA